MSLDDGAAGDRGEAAARDEDLARQMDQEKADALSLLMSEFLPDAPAAAAGGDAAAAAAKAESGRRFQRDAAPLIQRRFDPTKASAKKHILDAAEEEAEQAAAPAAPLERTEGVVLSHAAGEGPSDGRSATELRAFESAFYRDHTVDTVRSFTDHAKTNTSTFSFGFDLAPEGREAPADGGRSRGASFAEGGAGAGGRRRLRWGRVLRRRTARRRAKGPSSRRTAKG